jgi:hypothetical protein
VHFACALSAVVVSLISFAEPWRPSYELPKDQWQWPAFGCSPFRLCRLFLTSRFSYGALFTDLAQRVRIWPLPPAAETREVSPIVQRKAMRHLLYLGLEKTVADPENALAGRKRSHDRKRCNFSSMAANPTLHVSGSSCRARPADLVVCGSSYRRPMKMADRRPFRWAAARECARALSPRRP